MNLDVAGARSFTFVDDEHHPACRGLLERYGQHFVCRLHHDGLRGNHDRLLLSLDDAFR